MCIVFGGAKVKKMSTEMQKLLLLTLFTPEKAERMSWKIGVESVSFMLRIKVDKNWRERRRSSHISRREVN